MYSRKEMVWGTLEVGLEFGNVSLELAARTTQRERIVPKLQLRV